MRATALSFVLVLLLTTSAMAAVVTTKTTVSNSGWTDLGVGPMLLGFRGSGRYAVGDAAPSWTGEGFSIRSGRSVPVRTTSHVWAMAGSSANVDVYAAPITPKGCSQATAYLARTTGGNEGGNATNITTLICGLAADGVWGSLDALYVLAQQNQTDALLNLIGTSYSITLVGIPTFTTYVGFGGFAAVKYLNTTFNPTTAISPHFTQNSASVGFWTLAAVQEGAAQMGNATSDSTIFNDFTDTKFYARINNLSISGITRPGNSGLFVGDRENSTTVDPFWNGIDQGALAGASSAPKNFPYAIGFVVTTGTAQTISAAHIGASLGSAGNLALYNRLRTYMTAIGVP